MKIKQTVERECCQLDDLLPYRGMTAKWIKACHKPMFCKYCGQVFYHGKEMNGAGSYDSCLKKIVAGSDEDI